MRLKDIYEYQKERFPEFDINIASRMQDGKEVIHVEHKVFMNVSFAMDDEGNPTLEDIATAVREGLYQFIIKSQIGEPVAEGEQTTDSAEVETTEADEEYAVVADAVIALADTVVELVPDEDRKVILV